MSARNYAACPRCTARAAKKVQELHDAASAAFGKVDEATYREMLTEANKAATLPGNVQTFREDYEIYGADDGVVVVDYGGSCEACGLSLSFKDEHPIPGVTS